MTTWEIVLIAAAVYYGLKLFQELLDYLFKTVTR